MVASFNRTKFVGKKIQVPLHVRPLDTNRFYIPGWNGLPARAGQPARRFSTTRTEDFHPPNQVSQPRGSPDRAMITRCKGPGRLDGAHRKRCKAPCRADKASSKRCHALCRADATPNKRCKALRRADKAPGKRCNVLRRADEAPCNRCKTLGRADAGPDNVCKGLRRDVLIKNPLLLMVFGIFGSSRGTVPSLIRTL